MLVVVGFVFSSFDNGVSGITNQIYLFNCPFPVQNQIAVIGSPAFLGGQQNGIGATALNYTLNAPNASVANSTGTGTYFDCTIQTGAGITPVPQIGTINRNYGQTVASFPTGWFQYAGDTLGFVFTKVQIMLLIIYTFLVLPSTVTGIIWFALINVILIIMVALGIIIVVRGSGT